MATGEWVVEPLVLVREAEAFCGVVSTSEASDDASDLDPNQLRATLSPVFSKRYDEPKFEQFAHPSLYRSIA